jgi:hypothetical protein
MAWIHITAFAVISAMVCTLGCGGDGDGNGAGTSGNFSGGGQSDAGTSGNSSDGGQSDAGASGNSSGGGQSDAGASGNSSGGQTTGGATSSQVGGASSSGGATTAPSLYVGVRSSEYGPVGDFPTAEHWGEMANSFASRFDGAAPALVWIVGVIGDDNDCNLEFPSPGGEHPLVGFQDDDKHEAYLDYFDSIGVKVWLQVEPGDAEVSALIDLVLNQYGHHPSVMGFGVDAEWYLASQYEGTGKAVTDEEATAWVAKVQDHNPNFTLFLKHWRTDHLPPTARDGLIFIDDSQSVPGLDDLVSEFADWSDYFSPAPVGFQIGYEGDQSWWSTLKDPPGDFGHAILDAVPNTFGLFWVDFTMHIVFN